MSSDRSIALQGRPAGLLPATWVRSAAAILLGLLTAAALMLLARRMAGALAHPLEPAALLATGISLAAAATAIRFGFFATPHRSAQTDLAVMSLTSLCIAVLGASLWVPNTPLVGLVLLAMLLGAEETWAWTWHFRRGKSAAVSRPPMPAPPSRVRTPLVHDAVPPHDVTQQLTRSQAADGAEELSGWLRMAFVAGQRTGSLHVAFCPPFAAVPELAVEQLEGPEARIKTAQLLPHGARLDLKLAAVAEGPTSVLLQFSARTGQVEK